MTFYTLVALATLLIATATSRATGSPLSADVDEEHAQPVVVYGARACLGSERNCSGLEELEERLQDEVEDETDLEANMAAVARIRARELETTAQGRHVELLEVAQQLLALRNITTCGRESHKTLTSLQAAIRHPLKRLAAKRRGPARRIELVVTRYALNHALKCRSVYPVKFELCYANLIKGQIEQIDDLMDVMIGARLGASGAAASNKCGSVLRRLYLNFMDTNDSFKSAQDAALALNYLTKFGEHLASGDVREMVMERIISPCSYYTQQVGADIFIPAQGDSGVLDRSTRLRPSMHERRDGFIFGWARFGFCRMLQRDQDRLISQMNSLVPSV